MRGQGGFITLDFIFATVLVGAMFMVCLALTLTLSMAEVAQYITFSTARVYMAGDVDREFQRRAALAKYRTFASDPTFGALFFRDSSYFSLPSEPLIGDFNDRFPQDPGFDSATFYGVRAEFKAKILEFRVPLWGSTQAPDGHGYTAMVGSFLNREPTTDECMKSWNSMTENGRFTAIRHLKDDGGAEAYGPAFRHTDAYAVISDNGC